MPAPTLYRDATGVQLSVEAMQQQVGSKTTDNSDGECVVILTIAQDYHAALVHAALHRLGVPAHLISQVSLPGRGDLAVRGDWSNPTVHIGSASFKASQVRAFWNRRSPAAFNLPPRVHPADVTHITDAFSTTLSGIAVLLDDQFAVNRQASARVAANKLNQLKAAKIAGLAVPPTLVSNDPDEVRRFARTVDTLCMKPLAVYAWRKDQVITRTLTTIISDPARLDDVAVALMPVIYQGYIRKAYEVRLTVFGATFVGTRIRQPKTGEAVVDWRADRGYLDRLDTVTAPEAVAVACRQLLQSLGLRFGAFDFIVTPEGQWVFMEVNQAGQFIWQEQHQPDNPVLEPFARYLASADDAFMWRPETASAELSFASLSAEVENSAVYHDWASEHSPTHDAFSVDEEEILASRSAS